MRFQDFFRFGVINLSRRKARTVLTALSMAIGVMCIIVLISVGIGYEKSYEETIQSMGSLTKIDVTPSTDERGAQALLNDKAVDAMKKLDGVDAVTPVVQATAYLKNQRKQFESQLSPEASVNYTSLLSEIRALERELSSPKYENQLQEYSKLRDSVRNELEHQKIEKEDLSDRLQKSRQVLDEFSFTDEESIEAYRSQAETLYQDYQHAQASSSSKGARVFQVFFFVTAAICAISSSVSSKPNKSRFSRM